MLASAVLAGLDVVSILNEPTAVALAFGYGRGLARKRVLVCDLGGGTFDASVVEITGDDLEAVSTGGDNFLGCMDFDGRLADGLIRPMERQSKVHLPQSRLAIQRVHDKIRSTLSDKISCRSTFLRDLARRSPVDLRLRSSGPSWRRRPVTSSNVQGR